MQSFEHFTFDLQTTSKHSFFDGLGKRSAQTVKGVFLEVPCKERGEICMKKLNESNKLAIQMLIAMIAGIFAGLIFMAVREILGDSSSAWSTINSLLFQDITAAGGESSIGLFYIGGQLFIRARS